MDKLKIIPHRIALFLCAISIITAVYFGYKCGWHYVQMKGCEKAVNQYKNDKSYSFEDRDFKSTIMKVGSNAHESAMYEDLAKTLGFILLGVGINAIKK